MRDGEMRDRLPLNAEVGESRGDPAPAVHEQADASRVDEVAALDAAGPRCGRSRTDGRESRSRALEDCLLDRLDPARSQPNQVDRPAGTTEPSAAVPSHMNAGSQPAPDDDRAAVSSGLQQLRRRSVRQQRPDEIAANIVDGETHRRRAIEVEPDAGRAGRRAREGIREILVEQRDRRPAGIGGCPLLRGDRRGAENGFAAAMAAASATPESATRRPAISRRRRRRLGFLAKELGDPLPPPSRACARSQSITPRAPAS